MISDGWQIKEKLQTLQAPVVLTESPAEHCSPEQCNLIFSSIVVVKLQVKRKAHSVLHLISILFMLWAHRHPAENQTGQACFAKEWMWSSQQNAVRGQEFRFSCSLTAFQLFLSRSQQTLYQVLFLLSKCVSKLKFRWRSIRVRHVRRDQRGHVIFALQSFKKKIDACLSSCNGDV